MARPAFETACHELDERIMLGARYLVEVPVDQRTKPSVVLMRELFGLGPSDAVLAIREADRIRFGGSHHG